MFVMNRRQMNSFRLPSEAEDAAKIRGQIPPANDVAPVFCNIDIWCHLSGYSRSATYQGIAEGWLPSIKVGKSCLIDFHPAIAAIRSKFGVHQAA